MAEKALALSGESRNDELHRLLGYVLPQLERLGKAGEKNCLMQAVLITFALLNLYDRRFNSAVTNYLTKYLQMSRESLVALDVVITIVLFYSFMRIGYLINTYLFKRDMMDSIWKAITLPDGFTPETIRKALRMDFILELFLVDYKAAFGPLLALYAAGASQRDQSGERVAPAPQGEQPAGNVRKAIVREVFRLICHIPFVFLSLMLVLVFALNHALVGFYLHRVAEARPGIFLVRGLALVIISLHAQFLWTTPRPVGKVISPMVLVLGLLLYLYLPSPIPPIP